MSTVERLKQRLMEYFVSVGRAGRVYGPRDFNSQLLMNTYDPVERGAFAEALAELVDNGVLRACSPLEFTLTDIGLDLVRRLRQERRSIVPG